jgi:hypothetical protein
MPSMPSTLSGSPRGAHTAASKGRSPRSATPGWAMSRSLAPAADSSTWCSSTPATCSASPTLITPNTSRTLLGCSSLPLAAHSWGRPCRCAWRRGRGPPRTYGATSAVERYYCNFGLNPAHEAELLEGGLALTGRDADGEALVVELPGHPFFVATFLYVPQVSSTADAPHPLVGAFLAAARAPRAQRGPHHPAQRPAGPTAVDQGRRRGTGHSQAAPGQLLPLHPRAAPPPP